MLSEREKDHIHRISETLSQAAEGNTSVRLDVASEDNVFGPVANAVNRLLEKTDQELSSMRQSVKKLTLDARRYRNILHSLEETYFETDLKGRLLFFNGRALKDLGYTQEELEGLHFHHLVDEVNAGKVYEVFHDVFVTGRPNKGFEWEILNKNKEIIEVESSVALLHDAEGRPAGFRGVVRDISKRKQTERDLRQEEEKYRDILENMADTYLETDLRGNFIFFNDSLCRVLGYSCEELQGLNYRLVTPPERVPDVFKIFNEIYTTDRGRVFLEHELITKDGSSIFLEFSMSPLRSQTGEPIGFSGFGRDITEKVKARRKLEESERRLRLITDNISDIIWTMDFDLRFTYLSPSVLRLTGFTPEEGMNMPFKAMVPPATHAQFERLLADKLGKEQRGIFSDKDRTAPFEISLKRKDGSELWLEVKVDFNRDENGRAFEIIGIGRDISERKQAEEALAESEQRYRMIAERMTDVVWMADMDLRTTYVTPSVQTVLGFTPEERMLQTLDQQLTPESLAYGMDAFARELALEEEGKGAPDRKATLVLEYYHKDGSTRWMETVMTGIRNEQGALIGLSGASRDVTDRQKIEEQLRESEKRYRAIVENVNDIVWTIGLDLQFIYASPQNIRVSGYTHEELMGMVLSDVMTPESLEMATGVLSEELALEASGEPFDPNRSRTLELEICRKDGNRVWLEADATFNRNADATPKEILAVGRDITERKLAQEALRESEEKNRLLASYHQRLNDISIAFSEASGTDDLSNKIAESLRLLTGALAVTFSWHDREAQALRLASLSIDPTADDVVRSFFGPEIFDEMNIPMSSAIVEEMTNQGIRKPKDLCELTYGMIPQEISDTAMEAAGCRHVIALAVNYSGKVMGACVAYLPGDQPVVPDDALKTFAYISGIEIKRKRDEDQLRESEEKYRTILESIGDGYWEVDFEGRFVFFNDAMCTIAERTREELMGLEASRDATPETKEKMLKAFEEVYRTGIPAELADYEMIKGDGTRGFFEMSAYLMRDKEGTPVGFRGITRDVTKRKAMEEALAESEQRYRMIVENMNEIIWTISLDLHFTYVSPSAVWVAGYTPEETLRTPLDQLLTPESFAYATQRLADEMALEASGEPFDPNRAITLEVEAIHKEGWLFWLEITGTFNRDRDGNITEILVVGKSITERKEIETELQESEQRYRMIVENMHDIIWTMDLDFNYTYRSPGNIRITGYTPEEITTIPAKDQITPESYARIEAALAEELEKEFGGGPVDLHRSRMLEIEVYHKDGGTVWIEVTATFLRDEDGKPVELLLTARDITERKRLEDELEESEQRYRMIVENMRDVIMLMDLDLTERYRSPSAAQLTGYSLEELAGIPLKEQVTPESYALMERVLAEELEKEFGEAPVDPQRSRTLEIEIYHKDGGTVWIEETATFLRDEGGRPAAILLAARDVTERKRMANELRDNEERYRMIVENMGDMIATMDLDLRYTYQSPSIKRITGYSVEELTDIPVTERITPESRARVEQLLTDTLAYESREGFSRRLKPQTIEVEAYHKDGGTTWLEVTTIFTRDGEGRPNGVLLNGRDITERKKAEEEKDTLEKQLMQSQKMETVGRLAGGVAHDFNNMLSVILGYVDLAKLRLAKEHPVLNDIVEIERAAIRSRDVTTQLLAFSRKQIITPKVIDLNDLIAHTQKSLIRLIGEDIDLRVLLGEDLWAIRFDPSQIEQVLINLAINARDALSGGGKLTIETRNIVLDDRYCEQHIGFTPGRYVQLSVSDDGEGMDPETLQHVFEPFFTTKEAGKGTGLGLATVYGIVKQNGSFINVYSEPGYGTTFTIYVPRTTDEKEIPAKLEEKPAATGTGNILLVEDDPMVLEITKGMLEHIGYSVMVAEDPGDAISLCETRDVIDLVITDVVMPTMSGNELRNRLNDIRPDIAVLFMSGYPADAIAHHGVLEKGVHFLQKPFSLKDLARKVREATATD